MSGRIGGAGRGMGRLLPASGPVKRMSISSLDDAAAEEEEEEEEKECPGLSVAITDGSLLGIL